MNADRITSPQNLRVKEVVRLRDHRGRDERGRIVIDGRREVLRAVEAGVEIAELYYCPSLLGADDEERVLAPARGRQIELVEVTEPVFAKMSYGDRAEGLLAVAGRPMRALDGLRLGSRPLIAVVEGVEKPGNLGAILRSADAAGVDAVIAADPAADIYGPNAIRASLGTVFTVPLVEAPAEETSLWLDRRGLSIVAACPAGGQVYTEVDMTGPTAVVLGSEAHGLTTAWQQPCIVQAVVPMRGRADSLNLSITAALFFYEALRQRGGGSSVAPRVAGVSR
jgi:TrmH family RNA methyltransferase